MSIRIWREKSKRISLICMLMAITGMSATVIAGDMEDALNYFNSKNFPLAFSAYRKAADQGNPVAQLNLGIMYNNGQGVVQSSAQAVSWFRKSAEQGNANAQANLGAMYYNGQGVAQDYVQAVFWYRKAAEQGDALAEVNLGIAFSTGKGVAQDFQQAVSWFRKAANAGNALAEFNLAYMYDNGRGVAQDYREAVHWYHKAAAHGFAEAQSALEPMFKKVEEAARQLSAPASADPKLIAEGRRLFESGDQAKKIRACASCHGSDAPKQTIAPRLNGQSMAYITRQLDFMAMDFRKSAAEMENIADGLAREDGLAIAAYLQSR